MIYPSFDERTVITIFSQPFLCSKCCKFLSENPFSHEKTLLVGAMAIFSQSFLCNKCCKLSWKILKHDHWHSDTSMQYIHEQLSGHSLGLAQKCPTTTYLSTTPWQAPTSYAQCSNITCCQPLPHSNIHPCISFTSYIVSCSPIHFPFFYQALSYCMPSLARDR